MAPLTPSGVCHTAHPYESTGLTTANYTWRALLNGARHVEAARRVRDASCVVALAAFVLTCGPHLSLLSTTTPRILTVGDGSPSKPGMFTLAVMLNLLRALMKWVST